MQALINNTWNADYDIQKKIILIILTSCPKLKSTKPSPARRRQLLYSPIRTSFTCLKTAFLLQIYLVSINGKKIPMQFKMLDLQCDGRAQL